MKAMNAACASGDLQRGGEQLRLFVHAREHGAFVAANQAARRQQRLARLGGERLRLGERMGVKRSGVDDGVDQPAGARRLGVERLAEQQVFAGARAAEAQRREQRRARFRHQAEIDERHVEARARRRVDEVAVEAQRRPDADRRPFDRSDQRLGEARQRVDEAHDRRLADRRPRRERIGEEIADVVAGREDAAAALDQQRADLGLIARLERKRRSAPRTSRRSARSSFPAAPT